MKRILLTLGVLLLASAAGAQEFQPPRPRPKGNRFARVARYLVAPLRDPDTLVAMAPFFVGLALDGDSTSIAHARCWTCTERNPFLPRRPSNGQLWLYGAVYSFGQAHAAYALKNAGRKVGDEERVREWRGEPFSRSQRWFYDNTFRLYLAGWGAGHALAAVHNYRSVSCPSGFHRNTRLPAACVSN